MKPGIRWWGLGLAMVLAVGCKAPGPSARSKPADLVAAERLYEAGQYRDALIACVRLSHDDPQNLEVIRLREKVLKALADIEAEEVNRLSESSRRRLLSDLDRAKLLPDTYGLRTMKEGEYLPFRTGPTRMQELLNQTVTVVLEEAGLQEFVLAIGESAGINLITDSGAGDGTFTIRAENVPLREVLDYVARNLGVTFFVGENLIWVTAGDDGGRGIAPMDTRVYRLRKGLVGPSLAAPANDSIGILDALTRFVPQPDGSDLLYDAGRHILILRNTRENLARSDDIINALDVTPPQVRIQARFLSAGVSDLRELGIDWIMKGTHTLSEGTVYENGVPVTQPRTQISNASIRYPGLPNQAQGLNLTFEGLLTQPQFEAVLHALEIYGKSRTLSAPSVTTMNHREARIRIGEDFRFFENFDVISVPSTTADGSTVYTSVLAPTGTPTLQELGIELVVIPSVGADLRDINLKLRPEISEFIRYEEFEVLNAGRNNVGTNGFQNGSGVNTNQTGTSLIRLPVFRRSYIETELAVQSGQTVVMGGLVTSTDVRTENRVPFLGSIPILGKLFRRDSVEEIKQNLLIFVSAYLLTERGETLVPLTYDPPAEAQPTGGVVGRTSLDQPAPQQPVFPSPPPPPNPPEPPTDPAYPMGGEPTPLPRDVALDPPGALPEPF